MTGPTAPPDRPEGRSPPGRTAGLAQLALEAPVEMTVTTGSMAPVLPAGSRVAVRPEARYRAGDVLVFENSAGDLVAHRMLGRRRVGGAWRYVTRGDATPRADGLVPPEKVVGRVVGGVPWSARVRARLRYLAYWLGRLL